MSGIYFGCFGVVTAILVDYGGALVGMVNAMLPIRSATKVIEMGNSDT